MFTAASRKSSLTCKAAFLCGADFRLALSGVTRGIVGTPTDLLCHSVGNCDRKLRLYCFMRKTSRISDPYVGLGCRHAAIGQFFPPFLTLHVPAHTSFGRRRNKQGRRQQRAVHPMNSDLSSASLKPGKERRVAVCAPHTLAYPFLITHCRRQNKLQACRGYLFNGRHIPAVRALLWHAESLG